MIESQDTHTVVTRIAPSPTGEMHIGTVRTALFNYLFAKQRGGTYFVRIEDTDKERNKEEWVDAIWRDFTWCGIEPNLTFRTSEHLERHIALLHSLINSGAAYISKEPSKVDPSLTVEVIRLRNEGKTIVFQDLIRGEVRFDTAELGDFVIARSTEDPLYHFAVVADDGDAGVTHILRAEEHISNTPRQILIQEALGLPRPTYAHLPLILAPDRSKLSKRKHGASVAMYRTEGYLPEALINYLVLLGWNPGGEEEIFTLQELISVFSLDRVHKGGAIFDSEKFTWINQVHMRRLDDRAYLALVVARIPGRFKALPQYSEKRIERFVSELKERAHTFGEIEKWFQGGEYDFIALPPTPDPSLIAWKHDSSAQDAGVRLKRIQELLSDCTFESPEAIKDVLWEYAEKEGKGEVLWPLRTTLTGKRQSPDPFTIAYVLGKEETLHRINAACDRIRDNDST